MSKPKWDYPSAFSSWHPTGLSEETMAIARVMRSGQLTMGPEVAAFEREFADFHGRKHGIMVNSGSSANLVAVACLFHLRRNPLRRDDDEMRGRYALVPALAWSTTYAPLVQHGLKLRVADCDATWNAEPAIMGQPMPRVAVICSILGNPCYGGQWRAAADHAGAFLIEDNCESFGAKCFHPNIGRTLCGKFGHLSTFSFFWSHQISAIEGGMILTDDEEMANLCRILRAHGWTRDVWHDPQGDPAAPPRFELEYEFTHFGYNVRPLEMHAAIAREQLKKAEAHQEARRRNASIFREMVGEHLPILHPVINGVTNPFGLHFRCDYKEDRPYLVEALRANGIDCRLPTGGSLRLHPYGSAVAAQQTPFADMIHQAGLFLGNAPFDISDKIEKAVKVMRSVFDARARAA